MATQTTAQIKALQDQLVKLGYMTQADVNTGYGTYGPKTTAAVNAMTVNGGKPNNANSLFATPAKTPTPADYNDNLNSDPSIKTLTSMGSSLSDIENAYSTGDFSNVKGANGSAFNSADTAAALAKATAALAPAYQADQNYDTQAAQSKVAQDHADYNNQMTKSATQFQSDKTTLDQNAADSGVLFSGGRYQKEQALQTAYNNDQAAKLGQTATSMGTTMNDLNYKYGSGTSNPLSQYYNLSTNNYNANVANGGVTSGSLASVYNPGSYNYQGTANVANKANAQTLASGYLANQGNKLLTTGYSTKL